MTGADRGAAAAQIAQWLRDGVALHQAGRLDAAAALYARLLAAQPGNVDALNLSGVIALQQGDAAHAVELIGAAVAGNPFFADALANLGNAYRELSRPAEAVAAYDRALRLQPKQISALVNRSEARRALGQCGGAADDLERAFALAPDLPLSPGQPAADRARVCDWTRRAEDVAALRGAIAAGREPPGMLEVMALCDDPDLQQQAAARVAPGAAPVPAVAAGRAGPIRIGYFSGDFRGNAMAFLIAELIELHDRDRFEVVGYSWGPVEGDPFHARFRAAFDRFEDVSALNDAAVASLARDHGIDIALDLGGYTRLARPGVFAQCAAPVQVNYLGYPGTLGADWADYIIADRVVIPPGSEQGYAEQVVWLPGCYQPNDRRRAIARTAPSRRAEGLPEGAFVFACFNQPYKIDPELFAGWMGLLRALPGSVLWLIGGLPEAAANLRAAAQTHGVAGGRLVFAAPVPLDVHLARHALADLALDTRACNGHTTTSDALWAGLPVVTCPGKAFAARVAASLLDATGLPELVAGSLAEYLALAGTLARDPGRMAELQARLAAARDTCSLFDTPAYVRGFEAALAEMHRRRCAGLAPAPIKV